MRHAQDGIGSRPQTPLLGMIGVGTLQGICFYALVSPETLGALHGFKMVLWAMSFALVLTLPLLWYLTEKLPGLSTLRRVSIVFSLGFVIAIMLVTEYIVLKQTEFPETSRSTLIASGLLAFIGVPLLAHLHYGQPHRASSKARDRWYWSYPELFQTVWRNATAFSLAALISFVCLLMVAIGAAASLLGVVAHMPGLALAACAVLFGSSIGVLLAKEDVLTDTRRFMLAQRRNFPLVAGALVMWSLMSLKPDGPLPPDCVASVLLSFPLAILWVAANWRFQDGLNVAKPSLVVRLFAISMWLLAIAALGYIAVALGKLASDQGWSHRLVWAGFLWVLAVGYFVGYTPGMVAPRRGWLWSVAPTNITMAAVACVGLVLLATPLADARSLAAQNQIQRLLNGTTSAATFNYERLALDNDRYGRDALKYLSQVDPTHPSGTAIIAGARLALDVTTAKSENQALNPPAKHPRSLLDQ